MDTNETNLTARITQNAEGMRVWQQERAIFEATERICELMEAQGINRTELADRLGTSKSYVTQLLDGTANMTLRKLSDVFLALGRTVHLHDRPIAAEQGEPIDRALHDKLASSPRSA